jgi:hypothetical protein
LFELSTGGLMLNKGNPELTAELTEAEYKAMRLSIEAIAARHPRIVFYAGRDMLPASELDFLGQSYRYVSSMAPGVYLYER